MSEPERTLEIPNLPELTFDEASHIYRLNNEIVPSVTQVMKPLTNAEYSSISEEVLNRAAERGTIVHESIENYLKFGFKDCPQEYSGYLDAFAAWYELTNPIVIGSEVRVYHKLMGYAGTLDLLCQIGEKLVLIDFKTTSKVYPKTHGVQLEAYSQALQTHGIKPDEKRILQIKKDANFKEVSFPANDTRRWRVFGALKVLYDYDRVA